MRGMVLPGNEILKFLRGYFGLGGTTAQCAADKRLAIVIRAYLTTDVVRLGAGCNSMITRNQPALQ